MAASAGRNEFLICYLVAEILVKFLSSLRWNAEKSYDVITRDEARQSNAYCISLRINIKGSILNNYAKRAATDLFAVFELPLVLRGESDGDGFAERKTYHHGWYPSCGLCGPHLKIEFGRDLRG